MRQRPQGGPGYRGQVTPLNYWQPAGPDESYTPGAFDDLVGAVVPLIDQTRATAGYARVTTINVPGGGGAIWTVEVVTGPPDPRDLLPGFPDPADPWPFRRLDFDLGRGSSPAISSIRRRSAGSESSRRHARRNRATATSSPPRLSSSAPSSASSRVTWSSSTCIASSRYLQACRHPKGWAR
jgi:hypothetical protein